MSAVLLVLRTQRGESLADPELGVDWKGARRARGSRTENVRSAVLASLARLVARGVIGAPAVVVRVEDVDAGEREEVDVSFFDAALRERRSVTEPTQ
jgi:2-hydroxychromene-2-carboxylate isomerase